MQPAQPEQGPQPVTSPEYDKGDFTGVTMPESGDVGFGKSNDGYLGDEYKPGEPPTEMPEAVVPPNTPPEGPEDFDMSLYEDEPDIPDEPDVADQIAQDRRDDDESRRQRMLDLDDEMWAAGDFDNETPDEPDYRIGDTISALLSPESNDDGDHPNDVLQSDVEPVEDSE
ncbi:hypothetical protein KC973_03195 [Candidatus Saccharibacteria bacterium]|nr:hypothetical protein [Candidatus Saccharibacteria bacterium]